VEPCTDSSRYSLRDVGVFADDKCVGPSEFHHGLLDNLPRFGSDCGTCPHAAGYLNDTGSVKSVTYGSQLTI
jgi:hypothetical protein